MYECKFPITDRDPALDRAMNIAMGSMRQGGMANYFVNPEALASSEILKAWNKGMDIQLLWPMKRSSPLRGFLSRWRQVFLNCCDRSTSDSTASTQSASSISLRVQLPERRVLARTGS
jgi:hypothetical protein